MTLLPARNLKAPRPIVQLCVDVPNLTSAMAIARMGLQAGVDWIEFGTPLVSFAGINNFGELLDELPDTVTFLDAKVMDASQRYVDSAAKLGINIVCLCASASDATFRAAVAAGAESGVKIVGDLYAVVDPISRSKELIDLGVDYIYIHYGYDQQREQPEEDKSLDYLIELKKFCPLPVGIVTPSTESGERAAAAGADIVLVSHPFLVGEEAEALLIDYVRRVKNAAP